MISKEVQATLNLALSEAKRRRHEFVCIEHLLFALLQDKDAGAAIVHCGGDIARLKKALEEFFDSHMERLPAGMEREPADPWLSPCPAKDDAPCPVRGESQG